MAVKPKFANDYVGRPNHRVVKSARSEGLKGWNCKTDIFGGWNGRLEEWPMVALLLIKGM